MNETIDVRGARRLALARAGLLKPAMTGLPSRAAGRGAEARDAALEVVSRFGYLQLDSIGVTGARTPAIVLHSRLEGLDARVTDDMLGPGGPIYEYWGHAASWVPLDLYPCLAFRRRDFRSRSMWGDVAVENPGLAKAIMKRVRKEGPLRTSDLVVPVRMKGIRLNLARHVASALWSEGRLCIRERRKNQRVFDLPERVIPAEVRAARVPHREAMRILVRRSLAGHGWAELRTIVDTFRLSRRRKEVVGALRELTEIGEVVTCDLLDQGERVPGWARVLDLDLAARLRRTRPRKDRGVLLSPFDPVLWDRARVRRLFGFDYTIEIYKPKATRTYGYYCLPVLAGERLTARVDLKADRKAGVVRVLSAHREPGLPGAADAAALAGALARFGRFVGLEPIGVGS